MTDRTVQHESFVIERSFDARPSHVFAAWARPEAKRRWFAAESHSLDFRVGGREHNRGEFDGNVYTYGALFHEIVPGERIVYTYDMDKDDVRISVSLSTVELHPDGEGTRMKYTEQVAFFEGADTLEQRRHGTLELFDALARDLEGQPATA